MWRARKDDVAAMITTQLMQQESPPCNPESLLRKINHLDRFQPIRSFHLHPTPSWSGFVGDPLLLSGSNSLSRRLTGNFRRFSGVEIRPEALEIDKRDFDVDVDPI
jgi:hypothetical protein